MRLKVLQRSLSGGSSQNAGARLYLILNETVSGKKNEEVLTLEKEITPTGAITNDFARGANELAANCTVEGSSGWRA
jgi:hypothetical protein